MTNSAEIGHAGLFLPNVKLWEDTISIPPTTLSYPISLCPGQSVILNGVSYSQPGIVLDTIPGIQGCDTLVTYTIDYVLSPPPLDLGPDVVQCSDSTILLSAGPNFAQYRWQDGSTASTFAADTPGLYWVEVTDACGAVQRDSVLLTLAPPPIVVEFNPGIVDIELGDSLQLIPLITGASVADFSWMPANLLNNPDTLYPYTKTYQSQRYTLVVYDANGCSATGSIQVNIDPNHNVYIPNVFIANNTHSGLNDHFNLNVGKGVEIVNFMRVYDRWGSLVYERNRFYPNNNDPSDGWDGKYRGQYVAQGVYAYIIEVQFLDGLVQLYHGDVTVLR